MADRVGLAELRHQLVVHAAEIVVGGVVLPHMVLAEVEILALALAPLGRAKRAFRLAAGMAARRLDRGLFRRALGRLHPDAIEQARVQIHAHDLYERRRRQTSPFRPDGEPVAERPVKNAFGRESLIDYLVSSGRRTGEPNREHAGKNCRASDGSARSGRSRRHRRIRPARGSCRARGPGGGTHYRVRIVSAKFAGLNRVARHRLVYGLLPAEFADGLHALALDAKAPGEP